MRKATLTAAVIGGACALLLAAMTRPAAAGRDGKVVVDLLSFGSLQGDTQVCGCHLGPKGGMARRVAYLDTLAAHKVSYLQLDLGDFSSMKDVVAEYETRFVYHMMEKLKVDATAVGQRELSQWPVTHELLEKGKVPFVCSNVSWKDNGRITPIGHTSLNLESKGVRLALFSLVGEKEYHDVAPRAGIEYAFEDPFAAARRLLPELHKNADVVVLLSQMSTAETDSLVKNVPGIDVALYGHEAEFEDNAQRVASTVVNRTGVRGQYVGDLQLTVDPQGKITDFASVNLPLAKTMPEDVLAAKEVNDAVTHVKTMQDDDRARRQKEFEEKLANGGK